MHEILGSSTLYGGWIVVYSFVRWLSMKYLRATLEVAIRKYLTLGEMMNNYLRSLLPRKL